MENHNIENHKGKFCIYDNTIFCQEGYCVNCEIPYIFEVI